MQVWVYYIDQILIFAGLAMSLNLLLGYAGQVSVAHAAFGAVGGYAMGYYVTVHHWSFVPAAILGALFAFVLGVLMSLPAMKLSVEYLILLTLAVSYVIIGFMTASKSLGGTYGLTTGISGVAVFGLHTNKNTDWLLPCLVLVLLIGSACWRMGESAFGRVLKGVREDPQATQALGKNVFAYKVGVFGITSGMAGLCGAFYSGWLGLATPSVYGFAFSLTIFAMVIFGGMANLAGSVLGAAVIGLLEPVLRRVLKMDPTKAAFLQLILYGVALAVLMRLRAQGVLPEGRTIWSIIRRRKPVGRIEMAGADWVPDTKVSIREGRSDDLVSQERRDARWREAPIVLETDEVTKHFGGITAAEELHMELRKGTITALVGPNGAGKTTVFNLLTGFIPPDAGSVKLNGKELVGLTPDRVARLGLVRSFQDVRLFSRISVRENVLLGVQKQYGENLGKLFFAPGGVSRRNKEAEAKAMEWLEFVGMAAFADVPAGAISYGQSKLVSLARVLATDAEVLLLDEPASGIDTKWVDTMLDLVEAVREQGRTVCIVEHNLHVVGRLADHTYFMELGRITAEGTIDELTNAPRLAEAYFGTA